MIVRQATLSDAPGLTALLNEIIAIGGTTAHEAAFTVEDFTTHYLTGPDVICCHVALTDHPLGFQGLSLWSGLPKGWADIGTFVSPSARGSGAAPALFKATRDYARAHGFTTLNATIRADNALGLAYYNRMGFQDYATDPGYQLKTSRVVGRISKRFDLT